MASFRGRPPKRRVTVKGNAVDPKGFFGAENFERIRQEVATEGTIEGEQLTPEQRKEAFKASRDKVAFKNFVENFLGVDSGPKTQVGRGPGGGGDGAPPPGGPGQRMLPGTAVAPLVVRRPTAQRQAPDQEVEQVEVKDVTKKKRTKVGDSLEKNVKIIRKTVDSIFKTLSDQNKFFGKQAERERKALENQRRAGKEERFEEGKNKKFKKAFEKTVKPFSNILDGILNYLTAIFLGRAFVKLMNWFGDPDNQSKIESIGRFLKDWWPALLGAYLIFGNSLTRFAIGFIAKIGMWTARMAVAIIPKLLGAIAKNPKAAAAVGLFTAGATIPMLFPQTVNEQERATEKAVSEKGADKVRAELERKANNPNFYERLTGQDAEAREQLSKMETGETKSYGFRRGGKITTQSGKDIKGAGVDTQLIAARPGEVVINKETVDRVGADYFLSLNKKYGGPNANKPKVAKNVQTASGGGLVLPAFANGGRVGSHDYGDDYMRPRKEPDPKKFANDTYNKSKQGGGSGGFLNTMSFLGRVVKEAEKIVGRGLDYTGGVAGEVRKRVGGGLDYAGRVVGEAGKRVTPAIDYAGRVVGEGYKLARPTIDRAGNVVEEVGKRVTEGLSKAAEIPKGIYQALTAPEVGTTVMGYGDAGAEAIPAILAGFLGIKRTDTSISQSMQKAILDAQKTAQSKRRNFIEYEDYAETAGGIAGKYTMGRIADSEFLRDSKGRIIGMTQAYDTNRPAKESMLQAEMAVRRFFGVDNSKQARELNSLTKSRLSKEGVESDVISKSMVKPGGAKFQFGDVKTALYKPFEALLDVSQKQWGGKGATTHEVLFDEKVLGFKPVEAAPKPGSKDYEAFIAGGGNAALSGGKTVRDIVRSGRPLTDKNLMNQRKLEEQRPWWDKMGLFGGATAEKQRQQKNKPVYGPGGASTGSGQGQAQQVKPKTNQQKLIEKRPWWDKMGWFGGASAQVKKKKQGGGITESTGMNIPGATADRQLIATQPGEYILPVDTVMRLGGPRAIDRLVAKTDSNSTAAKLGVISKPSMAVDQPVMSDDMSMVSTLPPIVQSTGGGGYGGGGGIATKVPSVSVSSNSSRRNAKTMYGLV